MKTLYETTMINVGARKGRVYSPDMSFNLDVAMPKELGGEDTKLTNPEQLFAAAYSTCFNGALEVVLQKTRTKFEKTTVSAIVSLKEDPEDKGLKIAVKLQVSIDGLEREKALKYANIAHKNCPYSKAIRGNVDVEIEVI
ncbi:osmotically inducible protein C [Clostridium carboxidivorans P7]|uniref:OsmC family protein n=1 Tax=Clostridium carboxidivorans P7 TaxID=536227 RepID=C6PU73_9CLOT|nr:organic hydroperoxide resistance protein [Clostridium carboxidivorans]AKN31383.1 osmotically inducible protein C [Clostridium carboxidivorans P7]EET87171.1 OsmC family protein [Clostridium carboxidivorans P7]EFG87225.1 peroxiredoxin, Ohr family protein [Clostridium carboxidivorans P7]